MARGQSGGRRQRRRPSGGGERRLAARTIDAEGARRETGPMWVTRGGLEETGRGRGPSTAHRVFLSSPANVFSRC